MCFIIILSLIYLVCIFYLRKKQVSYIKIVIVSSLLFYIIPIAILQYNKYQIEQEMKIFDTNNDGFYSDNEINYKYEELERELITDSGSNLFILFGYPLCLIYSILTILLFKITDYLYIKFQ